MKYLCLLLLPALSACSDTRSGSSCFQTVELWGYAENRTSSAQNVEFSYNDPRNGEKKTLTAAIPAGATFEQKLREYSDYRGGSASMSGPRNAYCTSTPERSGADLKLTAVSFGQVKNCLVEGGSGLALLLPTSGTCPEFTTEQGGPN